MKTRFLFLLFLSQLSHAALPPQYQNLKDLKVIVNYIEKNEAILSRLESIDFEKFTIHYNNGCISQFGRKHTTKPEGWVGPADPLEYKSTSCSEKNK
jgi:hypothetical protein